MFATLVKRLCCRPRQSDSSAIRVFFTGFWTWGVNQPLGVPSSSVPSHSVSFSHLSPFHPPIPPVRSAVCFLVYTLLCVGRRAPTVRLWSQNCGNVTVLGVLRGCKNITVYNANANSPEATKFQNSIFSTLKCRPLNSAARGVCPLRTPPLPPPLTEVRLRCDCQSQIQTIQRLPGNCNP